MINVPYVQRDPFYLKWYLKSLNYFKTWGTGASIGGVPAIDEEDAEYKLSLSASELASFLDEEDYKSQQAIDKEKEEDEKAVSNTKHSQ